MNRSEVLKKIIEATEAIQDFKEGNIEMEFGELRENMDSKIEIASLKFSMESRTIGASGEVCDCCNGSGRSA